jgi:hypothetical protein
VSLLFLLPVAALLVQGALLSQDLGEPYPAISMPGFGGTRTGADGVIRVSAIEVEIGFIDPPSTARTTIGALLAPMPGSILSAGASSAYLNTAIAKNRVPASGLKGWIMNDLMPGRAERSRRRAGGNAPTEETVEFTRRRVQALYPDRHPSWVKIHRFQHGYRHRDGRLDLVERSSLDTYLVPVE